MVLSHSSPLAVGTTSALGGFWAPPCVRWREHSIAGSVGRVWREQGSAWPWLILAQALPQGEGQPSQCRGGCPQILSVRRTLQELRQREVGMVFPEFAGLGQECQLGFHFCPPPRGLPGLAGRSFRHQLPGL